MGCFVSGQYSRGHKFGGMIGYVFDGDIPKSRLAIEKVIRSKLKDLAMVKEFLCPCSLLPTEESIRETVHVQPTSRIKLFHIFVSMLK
jgi:hypothetical protein